MINLSAAIEAITAQQPKEENAVWMVGEQMKDMLRKEPYLAEIVLRDLEVPEMSLEHCEKKIKAWADQHKVGNFACVTPIRAEKIIREFYGLPEQGASDAVTKPEMQSTKFIDLTDFF